jgi:hypothetical protein
MSYSILILVCMCSACGYRYDLYNTFIAFSTHFYFYSIPNIIIFFMYSLIKCWSSLLICVAFIVFKLSVDKILFDLLLSKNRQCYLSNTLVVHTVQYISITLLNDKKENIK